MKKYAFYTLGCRANQYQTFGLKCQMTNDKCQIVKFTETADAYVINTCMVTLDAERTSKRAVRRALRQNPEAKVIVTGCWAKLQAEEIKKLFPSVILTPSPTLVGVSPSPSLMERGIKGVRIRANLMIQDGCEHFCTYCIVPHARGKVQSKPREDVLKEAEQLVKAGAREIVLTGINLATYQFDLAEVIKQISSIPELLRIRLSSLEPMYLKRELIDAAAKNPKVCRHFHLPLQSGDNNTLKAMGRNYSQKDYLETIKYIRAKMPECGITTDVIAGFPGEGERAFDNTIDLIRRAGFSRLHVFPYSRRKGTPAADFPGQVDGKTKKQRVACLRDLNTEHMRRFAEKHLNKEVEVLAEQKGNGLTSNYIRCFFNDPADSSGSLKKVFARSVNDSGEIRE